MANQYMQMAAEVAREEADEKYRQYLKNCLDDKNFDIESVESFEEWCESEADDEACCLCGSELIHERGVKRCVNLGCPENKIQPDAYACKVGQ